MVETSSEFCTVAHPDRLADLLAAKVIQDIQAKDGPNSHAAIEVFLTHKQIIFAGEATTTLEINDKYLRQVAAACYDRAGYIHSMRKYWNESQVVLPEDLEIVNQIEAQSKDIAIGTTDLGEDSGYNDQGIFYSSADLTTGSKLGAAHALATAIGESLFKVSRQSILSGKGVILGPDIKVVVTISVNEDGITPKEVTAVTIAQSHAEGSDISAVQTAVKAIAMKAMLDTGVSVAYNCQWVINGTGRFVVHGQVSDTSMTGRKLAVNQPSAGPYYACKMQGGGSMIKCAHASDLILSLASRFIANVVCEAGLSTYAIVGCAGAIGQNTLQSIFIKGDGEFSNVQERVQKFFIKNFDWSPIAIARLFGFFDETFDFSEAVADNFFGHPESQPWENQEFVAAWASNLHKFLEGK